MSEEERIGSSTFSWAFLSLGGVIFVLGVALFVPAGIEWWNGWIFLSVFSLQMILAALYLWRTNPAIYVARSKIHQGTMPWDKVLLVFILLSFAGMFFVAGLDQRFHWSLVPVWLIILGYILLTAGMVGSAWAQEFNKFAEPGVRIQTERGHKVVDTGPYAVVRHPLYVAGFILLFGIALALGSYWALIPVAVATLVIVVRTALEDRMLHEELAGYREYASRVRYRLIPGVW